MASRPVIQPFPPIKNKKAAFQPNYRLIDRVAYRGDTRHPDIIFTTGFTNRRHPDSTLLTVPAHQRQGAQAVAYQQYAAERPEYRNAAYHVHRIPASMNNPHPARPAPQLDINPESAVCMTLRVGCAPYFPIYNDPVPIVSVNESIWIYAMRIHTAVNSFLLQQRDHSPLAPFEEVAAEHVPWGKIIGAVECIRSGGPYPATMEFNFLPHIRWNPNVEAYERQRSRAIVEREFDYHIAHRNTVDRNANVQRGTRQFMYR